MEAVLDAGIDLSIITKREVIDQIHKLIDENKGNFKIINLYESDFDSNAVFGKIMIVE